MPSLSLRTGQVSSCSDTPVFVQVNDTGSFTPPMQECTRTAWSFKEKPFWFKVDQNEQKKYMLRCSWLTCMAQIGFKCLYDTALMILSRKENQFMRIGVIKCVEEKRWQRKDASFQTVILSHCLPEWGCRNVQFYKGMVGTLAISKSTYGTHSNIIRNMNSQICWLSFAHLTFHTDILFDQTEEIKAGRRHLERDSNISEFKKIQCLRNPTGVFEKQTYMPYLQTETEVWMYVKIITVCLLSFFVFTSREKNIIKAWLLHIGLNFGDI